MLLLSEYKKKGLILMDNKEKSIENKKENIDKGLIKMAERLVLLRGEQQQKAVANELGLKPQVLAYYEKAKRHPDFETLNKLAKHYGVTVDYLTGNSDYRTYDDAINSLITNNSSISTNYKEKLTDSIKRLFSSLSGFLLSEENKTNDTNDIENTMFEMINKLSIFINVSSKLNDISANTYTRSGLHRSYSSHVPSGPPVGEPQRMIGYIEEDKDLKKVLDILYTTNDVANVKNSILNYLSEIEDYFTPKKE
jgi:transcriptional regulator with XRE-family HTH domain